VAVERKYKQHGYMDHGKPEKKKERPPSGDGRPRHQDQIGPRTPRMVGTVTRARCSNCGGVLNPGFDANGKCPRCQFDLHSCKQCAFFDTGAQYECTQRIAERIPRKDLRNTCSLYKFRTTVEKDTAPTSYNSATPAAPAALVRRRPKDARQAFDDLFKK
jgi:hypothetical protein